MSKTRNIVVCIDNLKSFEETHVKDQFLKDELAGQNVTFLHVFEKTFYNDEFSEYSWPPEERFEEIEQKVDARLNSIASHFSGVYASSKVKCIISDEARMSVTTYLKDTDADMVIVHSRGLSELEELFLSSMTEHLVRNTRCPVLVLRETK